MYRFFVPRENIQEGRAVIRGDDVNHIRNVLRMAVGGRITITCGRGMDYLCAITEIGESEIALDIQEETPTAAELPVEITLFQALPKKDKMELVIQKAVELGAVRVVPFRARRCVVKLEEKKEEKKLTRWRAIAEAAAKQSGRGIVPEICGVCGFTQALEAAREMETVLIPYELCDGMKESVDAVKKAAAGKSVGILIGPEGGFERGEIEQASACGAVPISLGRRILRTETAGLAVLSVLMFMIEGQEGRTGS